MSEDQFGKAMEARGFSIVKDGEEVNSSSEGSAAYEQACAAVSKDKDYQIEYYAFADDEEAQDFSYDMINKLRVIYQDASGYTCTETKDEDSFTSTVETDAGYFTIHRIGNIAVYAGVYKRNKAEVLEDLSSIHY